MTDILFTYQHKNREIEALCLLKVEMERRGYTSEFLCTFVSKRLLSYFRRTKLSVSSALYDDDVLWFFVYDIVGFSKKVINLQWEQVLSNFDEDNPNCFHNPKGYAKEAVHLCWGEEPQKRITRGGVDLANAPITGAVHLDFLIKEFECFFLNKIELSQLFELDSKSEWCLFISSFTMHNMTDEEFTQLLDCYGQEAIDLKQITIESKKYILSWIEKALRKFPEKLFIYRPHPDETSDDHLIQMENTYSNFKIIPKLSVKQWIKCADKVYTWFSTSAAEIVKANKGFDILRPIEIPLEYDVSYYRGSEFILTEESFFTSLNKSTQSIPLNLNLLNSYYLNDNAYPAYMRVADILENALKTSDLDMNKHPTSLSVNFELTKKVIRKIIKDFLFNLLGVNATKLPLLRKTMQKSYDYSERLKRDLPKNIASQEEIDAICDKLRPIVNADLFSKNKLTKIDV